jgi:hypothetical protein
MTHDPDGNHCPHHGHHHHHDHSHDHGGEDIKGFRVRVSRWREHNLEHQKTLEEWADKMKAAGLEAAAAAVARAADAMLESVAALDDAARALD